MLKVYIESNDALRDNRKVKILAWGSTGVLTALLSLSTANAESNAKNDVKAEKAPGKGSAVKVKSAKRPALRNVNVSLAKTKKGAGSVAPRAGAKASPKNEEVVPHRIVDSRQRAAILGAKRAPSNRALDEIEKAVLKKRKRANGKVVLSMRVEKSGKVKDVFVVGFDSKLDAELEKIIAATRYPELKGRNLKHTLLFKRGVVTRR